MNRLPRSKYGERSRGANTRDNANGMRMQFLTECVITSLRHQFSMHGGVQVGDSCIAHFFVTTHTAAQPRYPIGFTGMQMSTMCLCSGCCAGSLR